MLVVRRALMRLPAEQRAAVLAVDMHGYSVADAAALLGVAEGTVKSRCARGPGAADGAAALRRCGGLPLTRHTGRVEPTHTVTPASTARAAHARRPAIRTGRLVAAGVGVVAVLAAVGVGTAALLKSAGPTASTLTSASLITVTPKMPISSRELNALVARSPDFGPLADPKRRAACLSALGYPGSVQVLGAETLQVDGQPAIVLVLPGDQPDVLIGVTVAATCSSVDTGLIADTTVRRP